MNKEWENPFNQFNSMKILLWRYHLENCAKGNFLTPIMVDIDLSCKCNFNCPHCNAFDIIDNKQPDLPEEHWLKVADFLRDWGKDTKEGSVKSVCISGGGESLMNPSAPAIIERVYNNGMEVGVITNGSLITNKNIDILARCCRWVGISVDASNPLTYNKLKGIKGNLFNKVCKNIKNLCKKVKEYKALNGICFKFLLTPDNYKEIYEAVRLAKSLGVDDFHLRPVGYLNITKLKGKELIYTPKMLESIDKQMNEAMKLGNSEFHVYGIRHKFNPDLSPKKNFTRCWTIPLLPTFGADGNLYYCFDIRGRKDAIMCSHYPDVNEIIKFWNSEKHKAMVRNFDINSCTRCTFAIFNEAVEEVFLKDNMYRNFI